MREDRARLFVALDLPDAVRDALTAWRTSSVPASESGQVWRPVARQALHVTLCFLGSCPVELVGPVGRALACVAGMAARGLELGAPLLLPPGRPRVLAVSLADRSGALAGVQAGLTAELVRLECYTPERRAFRPHVTVARLRSGRRAVDRLPPAPPALCFDASAVTLYRSHTGREEARYEALETVSLAVRA